MKLRKLHGLLVLLALCACGGPEKTALVIENEDDISGLRVTTLAGTLYDIDFSKRNDIEKVFFKTTADCVEAVTRGMADVMVTDEDIFTNAELQHLGLKIACLGSLELPTAFGFKKGNQELVESFNAFLSAIQEDGSLEAMREFWQNSDGVEVDDIPRIPQASDGAPLRVGSGLLTAPTSYIVNDEWVGFEVELVRRFAYSIGRPVEFQYMEISSMILALQTDEVDVMMGSLSITEDRKASIDFGNPYIIKHPAFFVKDYTVHSSGSSWLSRFGDRLKRNFIQEMRWKYITDGLLATLEISFLSILLGSLLGVLLCLMSFSKRRWMRDFVSLYQLLMRGLPMLVLLLFMFYVVFSGTSLNATMVAVVAFSINFASGAGATFRSAVQSIPRGQTEAGLALGFSRFSTFWNIVFPQALRKGLPAFKGNCIALVKGTSIVGYIAVRDLTRASDIIRSRTFDAFLPLVAISIIYLILAWLIGALLDRAVKTK